MVEREEEVQCSVQFRSVELVVSLVAVAVVVVVGGGGVAGGGGGGKESRKTLRRERSRRRRNLRMRTSVLSSSGRRGETCSTGNFDVVAVEEEDSEAASEGRGDVA
jgi:hypothetical protein